VKTVAMAFGCIFLLGLVHSGERLTMRVTPPVAMAPAGLIVRTTIESRAENRTLSIVAESATYFRSSEISLDGSRAPRVSEWVLRNLPAGRYEITATLVGEGGERATTTKWFQAVAAGGQ
jgi:hypothetical protein